MKVNNNSTKDTLVVATLGSNSGNRDAVQLMERNTDCLISNSSKMAELETSNQPVVEGQTPSEEHKKLEALKTIAPDKLEDVEDLNNTSNSMNQSGSADPDTGDIGIPEMSFEDIIANMEGIDKNNEGYLAERDATGRILREINKDPKRPVRRIPAIKGVAEVAVRKYGDKPSEGGQIRGSKIESQFRINLLRLKNKTQLALMLANGVLLYGYVNVSKESALVYLPVKSLPEGFVLPGKGKELPLRVAYLIIG